MHLNIRQASDLNLFKNVDIQFTTKHNQGGTSILQITLLKQAMQANQPTKYFRSLVSTSGMPGSAASKASQQAANTCINSISSGQFTGNYSQTVPVRTLNYNHASQSASQPISLVLNVFVFEHFATLFAATD